MRFLLALESLFVMMGYGILYGMALGTLFGTLTLPIAFSAMGFFWGIIFGAGLGTVVGMVYGILLFIMGHDGVNRARHWIPLLGAVITGGLFYLVNNIWSEVATMSFLSFYPFILVIYSIVAAFACAYATDHWYDFLRRHSTRKLKDEPRSHQVQVSGFQIYRILSDILFQKIRPLVILSPIIGIFFGMRFFPINITVQPLIGWFFWLFVATMVDLVYIICQLFLIILTVTIIVAIANRYFFTTDTDPHIYKRNLSILTFCLVLPSQLVVGAVIGAPIAAFIATLAVRDYADWVHSPEKQKVKPKVPPTTANDILKEALKP
ncbi:MAG: hypothetical protein KC708_18600 [Anaerolineae bacterium]|nr:hypothetical protein [Anaerolineae bacterium]